MKHEYFYLGESVSYTRRTFVLRFRHSILKPIQVAIQNFVINSTEHGPSAAECHPGPDLQSWGPRGNQNVDTPHIFVLILYNN
jgi:hypothetical protein